MGRDAVAGVSAGPSSEWLQTRSDRVESVTRPHVVVIGHDAGGNAIGRALVLAELLEPAVVVRVVAFGDRLWGPAVDQRPIDLIPTPRLVPELPAAARRLQALAREADLIIAIKPRVLSYGLAAAVRDGRPLLLDIDDLEHRFTRRRLGWIRQVVEPDREPITRWLEQWRRPVAAVTTASRALQGRYGGTWLPHIRERSRLRRDALGLGTATRARLALGDDFVVGFVGTVRPHKGLNTLAEAVAQLGARTRLLLAGDLGDESTTSEIASRAGGALSRVDWPTMEGIGGLLGACDVIAIPQSRTLEARYQSPAKLFDALAAGRPVVAGDVGDAREVVADAGVLVPPDDPAALAAALRGLRDDPALRARLAQAARARHEEAFGLETWRATLRKVVLPLVGHIRS